MSVVVYTSLHLRRLTIVQLQRIAIELGLIGLEGKEQHISRILEWQSGKSVRRPSNFSAGMLTSPALGAYDQLLDFYDAKKETANMLLTLSPVAFEGVIQRLKESPALPSSPHTLRVAYLLMQDKLELELLEGKGSVATAVQQLHRYFKYKDWMFNYFLTLNDATLFSVVDQFGANLVIAEPYVQINNDSYEDKLAVVYYLITLQVR